MALSGSTGLLRSKVSLFAVGSDLLGFKNPDCNSMGFRILRMVDRLIFLLGEETLEMDQ